MNRVRPPSSTTRASRAPKEGGLSIDRHGYDAGKKINGKKRRLRVNTEGLLLSAIVNAADAQNREGGVLLIASLFGLFAFLCKLYTDGGYQWPVFSKAETRALRRIDVEIVRRSDRAQGFEVLPKRWVVERTIG